MNASTTTSTSTSTNTNTNTNSQKPFQTLYINPATHQNDGLIATIGRKSDMDIVFHTEKSMSRKHAVLRFVAIIDDIDDDGNGNDNDSTNNTTNKSYFAAPRNKKETTACENSPYGMCLVLENLGKSGSFVASRDKNAVQPPMGDDNAKQRKNNNDNNDSDDETTDDEDDNNGVSQLQSTQNIYATSMTTQTQDGIVEEVGSAPLRISNAIRNHFGSSPVQFMKIDTNANHILSFGSDNIAGKDEDVEDEDEKNNNIDIVNRPVSIMIQFGAPTHQSTLPTIKITRIPMNVVMSSSVPSSIQKSLRFCGGLLQKNGALPRYGETTHLIVPERMPVAKQIIAWCYGIPRVSPDFIEALNNHQNVHDPFPDCSNYPTLANDTNEFWDEIHDKKLLSNYIMISADEPSEFESERLAEAAGAIVERLYDTNKKPTKGKITIFTKQARKLLSDTKNTTTIVLLLLSSRTSTNTNSKTKSSGTNTNILIKKLKDMGIETINPKILAKAITHKVSDLTGLKNGSITTTATTTGKRRNSGVVYSELEDQKKRTKNSSNPGGAQDDQVLNNNGNGNNDGKDSCRDLPSSGATMSVIPIDNECDTKNENRNKRNTSLASPYGTGNGNCDRRVQQRASLGKADANGWYAAGPKDDHERMKWRQIASETYKDKTGDDIERSASTNDVVVKIMIAPTTTQPSSLFSQSYSSRGHQRPASQAGDDNVPNFKKFKKNYFKKVDPNDRIILLQATSSTKQNHHELSAEQREIEEDQRLADALFKGDPVPIQKKRSRRRT